MDEIGHSKTGGKSSTKAARVRLECNSSALFDRYVAKANQAVVPKPGRRTLIDRLAEKVRKRRLRKQAADTSLIRLMIPADLRKNRQILRDIRIGNYELEEVKALLAHLQPDDRFLDLGSGIGYVAIHASKILKGDQIWCIEANPDLVPIIKRNLKMNGCEQATVQHGAVLAETTSNKIDFFIGHKFSAASIIGEGRKMSKTLSVPALNFQKLVEDVAPTVISCDVEGEELNLFQTELPAHVRAVIMEIHRSIFGDAGIQHIFEAMHRNGFVYSPVGSFGNVVCFHRSRPASDP